ncbi:NUDIX domain-containing protein [Pseudovibrio brasiliensis]|uniref:8-oxo-dGTP diphosphatase n=1 Tax=Pseudovibrio brasiliensis TaxID=1898042 RepID=A0ABX8AWB8_9HYPH|nr:NUDIX domain-containing protein [Pseudovibrio brasiliensis]QUS58888.1 NUDIX domain-containing protein [Pseudovibrio brasiliensis]
MTDIVNGMLVQNGRVLMGLRSASRKNYPGLWSFVGGHVEAGETLEQALIRELGEEVGIKAQRFAKVFEFTAPAPSGEGSITFHLFTVDQWQGTPENLGDEHSEVRWVAFEEAIRLPGIAFAEYQNVFEKLKEEGALQ